MKEDPKGYQENKHWQYLQQNSLADLGHIYFLFLLCLSVWFFRERAIFLDAAFQVFTLINTRNFMFEIHRFSPFIAQLLPLAAIKLALPLNVVLVLYSISAPLVSYCCFLIARYGLKNTSAALAIWLASAIMLYKSFFYATGEINMGISFVILGFGLAQKEGRFKWHYWLILLAILSYTFFFHPLVPVAYFFAFGLGSLHKNHQTRLLFGSLFIFGIVVYFLRNLFLTDSYETQQLGLDIISNLKQLPSNPFTKNFIKWLYQDYFFLLIFVVVIIYHYSANRKLLRLFWFLGFLVGYTLLVLLAHPDKTENLQYYAEHHFQVFAAVVAVPFALDIAPGVKRLRLVSVLFLIGIITKCALIYSVHHLWTDKHTWFNKVFDYTDKGEGQGFIMEYRNNPDVIFRTGWGWGTPVESFLFAASTNRTIYKSILLPDDINSFNTFLDSTNFFFTSFGPYPIQNLNPDYFPVNGLRYFKVNTTNPDTLDARKASVIKINAVGGNSLKIRRSMGLVRVPVTITSPNYRLASFLDTENAVYIGYEIIQNGAAIETNNKAMPLEMDVQGKYSQIVHLDLPKATKPYQIRFNLNNNSDGIITYSEITELKIY